MPTRFYRQRTRVVGPPGRRVRVPFAPVNPGDMSEYDFIASSDDADEIAAIRANLTAGMIPFREVWINPLYVDEYDPMKDR